MAAENRSSAAVKRGPIVYCFEGVDNPGISARQARLKVDCKDPTRNLKAKFYPDLLKGVTVITSEGMVPVGNWGLLYRPFETEPIKTKPVILRAIPYYAWDNRGSSEMNLFFPEFPKSPSTFNCSEKEGMRLTFFKKNIDYIYTLVCSKNKLIK
ncbi:hypothetical protein ES703_32750 [subsurface metagenome]